VADKFPIGRLRVAEPGLEGVRVGVDERGAGEQPRAKRSIGTDGAGRRDDFPGRVRIREGEGERIDGEAARGVVFVAQSGGQGVQDDGDILHTGVEHPHDPRERQGPWASPGRVGIQEGVAHEALIRYRGELTVDVCGCGPEGVGVFGGLVEAEERNRYLWGWDSRDGYAGEYAEGGAPTLGNLVSKMDNISWLGRETRALTPLVAQKRLVF